MIDHTRFRELTKKKSKIIIEKVIALLDNIDMEKLDFFSHADGYGLRFYNHSATRRIVLEKQGNYDLLLKVEHSEGVLEHYILENDGEEARQLTSMFNLLIGTLQASKDLEDLDMIINMLDE